jgi:palmitoyl-[glycerolipid] 3-(E)-desaturase
MYLSHASLRTNKNHGPHRITMLCCADFGSGVYHWGVDNYGSGETKFVGSQIAAFQGHHRRPWTITEREFCNNCSLTFKPAGYAGALFLALSLAGVTSAEWDVFAATASFFIAMSQQFHAWSHMKKSQLPAVVVALQDAGLLISRKAHGAHHKSPFNMNYCIVSGWCNPLLDSGLITSLEQSVKKITGVEPRGWYEPLAEWRELDRGEAQIEG